MLQRLFAITALLASAATLSDASNDVKIHVRLHHSKGHHHTRAANSATATGSGSGASGATVAAPSASGAYMFSPVTSIQARVQGNALTWDETTKTWVAGFGKTYEEKYRAVLDTVNTASVEGALMYVQAEGINVQDQSVKCQRKNNMQYIQFYQVTMVQPNASLAFYANKHKPVEYCPYLAMDGGLCTPVGNDTADACKQFDGIGGQPKLGHCVGAGEQSTDARAPYKDNYWFSFPNSCVTKPWASKTDECRKEFGGGLCAPGEKPDGIKCSFSYKVLGFLNIDDLVGITDGSAAQDGKKYSNFTEFCNAGNVEFSAKNDPPNGFVVDKTIDFWKDPGSMEANTKRTKAMIDMYNKLAPKSKVGTMSPLPEVADLTKANPACYLNSVECATASNGCRRVLYSQLCEVCDTAGPDCKVAPAGYKYPTLEVPKVKSDSSSGSGGSAKSGKKKENNKADAASINSAASGLVASTAAVVLTVLASTLL